eukprot:4367421-Prymnesium_polylepis.1
MLHLLGRRDERARPLSELTVAAQRLRHEVHQRVVAAEHEKQARQKVEEPPIFRRLDDAGLRAAQRVHRALHSAG